MASEINQMDDSATAMDETTPADHRPPRSKFPNRGKNEHVGGRGRGGRSRGRGERGGRSKRSDMGRAEWARNPGDRRERNDEEKAKRRRMNDEGNGPPVYAVEFSKEEVEQEGRKPKRKVAVLIGYSGSGYKGMQLNHNEKTIEGDLFGAFVAAGAISKANADDPKKSSLVRCARTDKGVHAAGNIISMKLIIEDPHIIKKINDNLSPQIRVWGMVRTNGSFSAYQLCDSRIYEYLIPSHCFLPPHPKTFLWKKLVELAKEGNDLEGFEDRQKEVLSFWKGAEEQYIRPVIEKMEPHIRTEVLKAFFDAERSPEAVYIETMDQDEGFTKQKDSPSTQAVETGLKDSNTIPTEGQQCVTDPVPKTKDPSPFDASLRNLKAAYLTAKKAHRIHPDRLSRISRSLRLYLGTHNFHNYTIQKSAYDASAKRVIKSFNLDPKPILIDNTEWLSLKVHGQSFMMHQIRKMVSMVALLVRCGCHEGRIQDTYNPNKLSIPKAPGLGLLLERPVFTTYNDTIGSETGRSPIDFDKFETEMAEFKQREIYERIFREEEKDGRFHTFFSSIDDVKSSQFLYLSSVGVDAAKRESQGVKGEKANHVKTEVAIDEPLDDDDANPEDG